MSKDYSRKLAGFNKKGVAKELVRFSNVNIKKGQLVYTDNLIKNENAAFDSLHLAIENSSYSPEYLRSIYVVDFYRILRKIEQQLKRNKK